MKRRQHDSLTCACGQRLDVQVEDGVATLMNVAAVVREHAQCLARAREAAAVGR